VGGWGLGCTYGSVHGEDEDHQEEGEVPGAVVLGEHEDEASGQHDWDGVHEEPEAVADSVARERVQERPDDHEDIWRGGEEEVRDVVGVVEGVFCQGWEEVLEAVRWKVSLLCAFARLVEG